MDVIVEPIEGWPGPVHPAAEIFPLMQGDEFADLVQDIKANGLLESIWVTPAGELLDGRNRVRACIAAGVAVQSRVYEGDDPVAFAISLNLKRRHLTTGQRAAIAADLVPVYAAEGLRRMAAGGAAAAPGKPAEKGFADLQNLSTERHNSAQKAADAVGVSARAVSQFKRVEEAAPELAEKVRAGELSLNKAERAVIRSENAKEADRLRVEPLPLPTGKFAVIELDPPWSYEEQKLTAPGNRNAEDRYATMTIEDIENLPIAKLAADNCHLYLWTTANHLRHSWALLEKWGFDYRSILVWHKPRLGMGHYYRNQAEFVLFGVKGRLPLLAHDKPNVYSWEAPRVHSLKPDGFYQLVEECSPSPRIRLFARSQRDGWESWGNQA